MKKINLITPRVDPKRNLNYFAQITPPFSSQTLLLSLFLLTFSSIYSCKQPLPISIILYTIIPPLHLPLLFPCPSIFNISLILISAKSNINQEIKRESSPLNLLLLFFSYLNKTKKQTHQKQPTTTLLQTSPFFLSLSLSELGFTVKDSNKSPSMYTFQCSLCFCSGGIGLVL